LTEIKLKDAKQSYLILNINRNRGKRKKGAESFNPLQPWQMKGRIFIPLLQNPSDEKKIEGGVKELENKE